MENQTSYLGFKELESWKKASELKIKISVITKNFPPEEKFRLINQIINSSRSITANIAEGYGRYTYTDTRHFFIQARGSATETIDHIITALDEKYITEEIFKELEQLIETIFKLINGYIRYLDKAKTANNKLPIPNP